MKRIALVIFLLPLMASIAVAQLKLPPYKKVKLDNGLTLLLMEQHEVPFVSFNVIVGSGSTSDPARYEGLASITSELLRRGTAKRTSEAFSRELDFIGGSLGFGADYDYTYGTAEVMSKDLATGVDLLADALLAPTFPRAEVEKAVRQSIDEVRSSRDEARAVIGYYFNSFLYGDHPYARPVGGDDSSLARIDRDAVLSFYDQHYRPGNTIIAAVGDFDAALMERTLRERFGAWPARSSGSQGTPSTVTTGDEVTALPPPAPIKGRRLVLIDKPDATQTFFNVGNIGISRTNPDRAYVEVINSLFGGQFSSMLVKELRTRLGLTYSPHSYFTEYSVAGPFFMALYTKNETTEQAIDRSLELLKELRRDGISAATLTAAKNYVKGQFPPSIETTSQLAWTISRLEFDGLDEREINDFYARVDAMTMADAKRIIDKYFPSDDLLLVLIGKADEIREIAKKYASKVETRSIEQVGYR